MGTFLFDKIIFGPVKSRRLGVSLGINLLPVDKKICTFDCIYCECGFNDEHKNVKTIMPTVDQVLQRLETTLTKMTQDNIEPNVITFAGNGEPTIHPDFGKIIDGTIALRNKFFPKARIAVLSNATLIHKKSVFNALLKVDDNILKLDAGQESTINQIDKPVPKFSITKTIEQLKSFHGKLTIQTMFVRGEYEGKTIDNTREKDINSWLKCLKAIKPEKVMIYTIERDTPAKNLVKVPLQQLNQIAQQVEAVGIKTQVSG